MPSDVKQARSIPASQLAAIASALTQITKSISEAAEVAKTQPNQELAIYNWSSAEFGLARLRAFAKAADDSKIAAQLGSPIQPGQLKPRSTLKKKSLTVSERDAQNRAKGVKGRPISELGKRKKGEANG